MAATDSHPAELFATVLGAAGGEVERFEAPHEVAAAIARIAHGQGVRQLLYEPAAIAERLGIRLLLAAHGVELVPVASSGDKAPHMRVALTGAELAIAATGTVLIGGRPGGWGLASVLPWVHVVVVAADDIVADLATGFARFAARLQDGEGDWVWVTGPSRTADIGHTLVLGAHGPNALHVVVAG